MRVKSLFAASESESNLFYRMEIAALMKRYALLCTRYRWKNLKERMGKKKKKLHERFFFFEHYSDDFAKMCVNIFFITFNN